MGDPDMRLRGVVASPLTLLDLAEFNEPALVDAINGYAGDLEAYVPALEAAGPHPAVLVVAIVALNDFNDLLFDCLSGRGRSAFRSARTQFEHLLNLEALVDPAMCNRFMSHTSVGTEAAARWNLVTSFLKGKALKSARHRQRVMLRDGEAERRQILAEYGAGFARQWHPHSVRQRAIAAGLEREYDFFRASSAAVHGAASAMEGSVWFPDGKPVVRVGPNVVMCPPALAGGLQFFSQLVDRLEVMLDLMPLSLLPSLDQIGVEVQEFCRYTNGIEHHLFSLDGLARPPIHAETLILPNPSET